MHITLLICMLLRVYVRTAAVCCAEMQLRVASCWDGRADDLAIPPLTTGKGSSHSSSSTAIEEQCHGDANSIFTIITCLRTRKFWRGPFGRTWTSDASQLHQQEPWRRLLPWPWPWLPFALLWCKQRTDQRRLIRTFDACHRPHAAGGYSR